MSKLQSTAVHGMCHTISLTIPPTILLMIPEMEMYLKLKKIYLGQS